MTEEDRILKESQETIKLESKKIADSVTRILMLGGPKFVQAILMSMLDANDRIMKTLKLDTEIEFNGGEK
jgi:hypothetical protein